MSMFYVRNNNTKVSSLIFESGGKIVLIEFPNSYALTDTGRNMVKSTAPQTLSDLELQTILSEAVSEQNRQDAIDDEIRRQYNWGYSSGINSR